MSNIRDYMEYYGLYGILWIIMNCGVENFAPQKDFQPCSEKACAASSCTLANLAEHCGQLTSLGPGARSTSTSYRDI